ncbi:MAG: Crp/Fnr family transcriptional regulator [Flammeovirgaceae bacterium]
MQQLFEYLQTISPITDEIRQELVKIFRPSTLAEGEFFVEAGKYAKTIGFLETGVVRAFFINQKGKEYNKQFFVGPTLIGAYTSLLTKQKNKIAQQALSPCKLWVASFEDIEQRYANYHAFERLGRKIAEYYFLDKEKKELEMALCDADKRYLIFREEFPTLELQIKQYHIASYLGISATQLSRIRRKLFEKKA